MARLTALPALKGVDLRIGANRILGRSDLALVSIATPLADSGDLTEALRANWSLVPPTTVLSRTSGDLQAISTGPDQMLLVFPHSTPNAEAVVRENLNGAGYTTDQSDAWVVLEISGPDTLAAMERLSMLDVARLPVNGSARTLMEHLGVLMVRLGDEHFLLMSASSSAESFLHAVEVSYRNVVA